MNILPVSLHDAQKSEGLQRAKKLQKLFMKVQLRNFENIPTNPNPWELTRKLELIQVSGN